LLRAICLPHQSFDIDHFDIFIFLCNIKLVSFDSAKNFEKGGDYDKTWKASEDGKVNTNGPRVIVGENAGPQGPIITR
jgi:synaptosomal-associated protein 25